MRCGTLTKVENYTPYYSAKWNFGHIARDSRSTRMPMMLLLHSSDGERIPVSSQVDTFRRALQKFEFPIDLRDGLLLRKGKAQKLV
jgi:hypothetical protein